MHTETVRDAILSRPFKPFTLRMNDGREFHIPHPEYVAVSKRVVVAVNENTQAAVYLEPVLIASLTFDEEKSAKEM